MGIEVLLKSIFQPSSKILNPKNKNHWIAMLRGYAVNNGWNKYEAKAFFTLLVFEGDFYKGISPKEAFENYKKDFEQPI